MRAIDREIAKRLGSLELGSNTAFIAAFRARWDEDLSSEVADVLLALGDDDWDLARVDDMATRIRAELDDLVAYTYCDVRPAPDELESFGLMVEGWI